MLGGWPCKKLTDWVRFQCAADGLGPSYCEACRGKRASLNQDASQPCDKCPNPALWRENLPIVEMLGACRTQWRVNANGERIGIDYTGLRVVAEIYGITLDQEFFALFQVLESAYVEALRNRAQREQEMSRRHG